MLDFLSRSAILTVSVLISMASHESPHTTVSQHVTTSSINLLMFYCYFLFFGFMRYALLKVTGRDMDPNYDVPTTVHHSSEPSRRYTQEIDLEDLEDFDRKSTHSCKSNKTSKSQKQEPGRNDGMSAEERMRQAQSITRELEEDDLEPHRQYGIENFQTDQVIYVDPSDEKAADKEDDNISLASSNSDERSMKSTNPNPRPFYIIKRPSHKQRLFIYSEAEELWETFRSVYGIGIVIFISFYASDLSSILPSIAFITSMLVSAIPDIFKMINDIPQNQTMHVPRLLSFFGYIMTCVGMACFMLVLCMNDSLPDTVAFCKRTSTPRVDIILGFLLPLISTVLIQQPRTKVNRNRITLYKASPFAVCISLFVVTVTSKDNVFNIVNDAPRELFFFFVVPITKGLAVISIISSCMHKKKIEVATLLSFILYCKELHLNKPHKEVLEGIVGALICSCLAMIVLIMKHSSWIAELCSVIFDVNIKD